MRGPRRWRVWFNQGLSSLYDAIQVIRREDSSGELTLLTSHSHAASPVRLVSDESWREPAATLGDDAYVDWCLRICRARKVELFVPGRGRNAISRRQGEFEAQGTQVLLAAKPEILDLVEDKDAFYSDLSDLGVSRPEHLAVTTADELRDAYQSLTKRHRSVCIKPARSTFGAGFHVLSREDDELGRLTRPDIRQVGIEAFLRAMSSASKERKLVVMELLPGVERSIDCLAEKGRLVAAVSRVKREGWQELETTGRAIELAAALTEHYSLNGIFNVQTRDARGGPHVLEINPRMSGGILHSCLSGFALPYWAVLLALGARRREEIPFPKGGQVIAPVHGAVVVGRWSSFRPPSQRNDFSTGESQ